MVSTVRGVPQRMTLQVRVGLLAAAVLAMVALLLGVLISGQSRDERLTERLDYWRTLLQQEDAVTDSLVRWYHAQRDYVLTGNQRRLSDSERHHAEMEEALRELSAAMPPQDPHVRRATGHLIAEILALEATTAPEVQARRRGDPVAASSLVERRFDAPGLDRTLEAADSVKALTEAQRVAAEETSRRAADALQLQQAVVGILALLLVPTVLLLVRRWILQPLARIRERLLAVSGGDLNVPVEVQAPPELADVASAAEAMRRRILDELAASVAAREALEQGQPLVMEVRAQLEPHALPEVPGWSAAAALRAAEGVLAGDWYDVVNLPDGDVAVLVTDVSGHGARAGIVAMQVKRVLESSLHLDPRPDAALALAARVFADEAERFASCLVAVLEPATGVLRYANAGHPPPLVLLPGGGGRSVRVVDQLDVTGPLLSWLHVDEPGAWRARTLTLAPGAALLAFTDGLIEARPGSGGEELGVEGVVEALAQVPDLDPARVVEVALEAARRRSGGRVRDDVTLVALARAVQGSRSAASTPRPVAPVPRADQDGGPRAREVRAAPTEGP
ncbi:serine phosphatase RsbU (regulator of sigma subunit) [Kineococcus xinjiangensis]|uniref:Serine phosphatase RsbU (Regulator of sigma subunit) n=1 Tax=Kineococcus xinjiangensis TaxID=512762 RepID=A0A2S6IT24_9ACTN|nr:serine phosphatase RsbU (regulator of sigma subunit) [Kineococcus xinjiangensis]